MARIIDSQTALNLRRNRNATWARARSRLRPDVIPVASSSFEIEPGATVFTIGSCFARNIEEHIARLGYDVPTLAFRVPQTEWRARPNGILNKYTPPAIAQELAWTFRHADGAAQLTMEDCQGFALRVGEDAFVDSNLGGFVPVGQARFLERRRQILELFALARSAACVTITLGLIEAWFDLEHGIYIQQAPATRDLLRMRDRFELHVLDYADVKRHLDLALDLLFAENPSVRVLLTTSPVPLERTFTEDDVIVATCHGKSVLRAAAGQAAQERTNVDYFASYEMVTMSQSSATWGNDLRHVTDARVGFIVSSLVASYFGQTDTQDADAQRAYTLVESGEFEPALELARDLIDRTANRADILLIAAKACRGLERTQEALDYARQAVEVSPDDEQGALATDLLLSVDDEEEARRILDLVIASDGGAVRCLGRRATLNLEGGALESAEADIKAALAVRPRNWKLQATLAEILAKRGETGDSMRIVRDIAGVEKPTVRLWRKIANVAAAAEHRDDALAYLQNALAMRPNATTSRRIKARIAELQGISDE